MKKLFLVLAIVLLLIPDLVEADSISETPTTIDNHESWWSFDAESYKPLGDGILDQQASFDLQVFESFSSQSQTSQTGDAFRSRGTSPTYALATTSNFLPLVVDFAIQCDRELVAGHVFAGLEVGLNSLLSNLHLLYSLLYE